MGTALARTAQLPLHAPPAPAGRRPCGRRTCPRKKVEAQKHTAQLRERGLCPLGQDQSHGHGRPWCWGGAGHGVHTERQGQGACDPTVGRRPLPANAGVHCSHFHPRINPSFSQGHHIGAAHTQAPQQTGRFSVASGDTRRASGEASRVGRARGLGSVRHASQLGLPLLQRMSHSEWKGGKEREPQT